MTDSIKLLAPWTAEQAEKLREWQRCGWIHPFLCPDHANEAHRLYRAETRSPGALLVDESGWICEWCGFTQDWAHDFMFKGAPPNPLALIGRAALNLTPTPIQEGEDHG